MKETEDENIIVYSLLWLIILHDQIRIITLEDWII